jgi:hypothetical protein
MKHRLSVYAAVFAAVVIWTAHTSTTDSALIEQGSVWSYLDNGSDQGTAWRAVGFSDAAWATGSAQLGYGDGDEATVIGYGPNSSAKYVTTYFRQTFTVGDPTLFQSLTLNLLRDDGAVAYLNGAEIFRTNMPSGTIAYNTAASSAIGGADESTFYGTSVDPSLLVAGTNVLAVEVHQANGTSSDVSFDAELVASTSLQITRGPYLQMGTPSSVVVRWRTGGPSDSQVLYGPDPSSLIWTASDAALTTEHEVTLTNLSPNTVYYYATGSTTQTLAGADTEHFFRTSPTAGTATPTRVWVLGDSGTANANARAVRDAYYGFNGSSYASLWLMLGDNAYTQGLDSEYQAAVFDMYPATLRQSVLWPTLGNHDGAAANSSTGTGPYYDNFTLPTLGEAGGLASGTEAYYSFDYGNIHFVNLESFETNRSTTGPMLTWLQNDLASTNQEWVVAFWHHPPYSKGSHDSDVDIEMREMREDALPILEAAGVDLVLTGHSHSYERSFLIDGHYGSSSTFTSAMKVNGGSGREDGTGAYLKPTVGPAPHEGTVYAVAGSSGQASGGALNHPAMFVSLNVLGSMVLDVDGNRLDARFIDNVGATRDHFTILKGSQAPGAFNTLSPGSGATGQPAGVVLGWEASSGASSYRYCVDTIDNDVCDTTWVSTGTGQSAVPAGLVAGTTYYWQVEALHGADTTPANGGAWWTFSVQTTADLLLNGDFSGGTTSWQQYATPDISYIVSNVTGGVLQFSRVPPPPGTSNQATVFQETGVALPGGAPVLATFDLGNNSGVRKRISVLTLDSNFTDLSVCTFWLPPNTPLTTYEMKTHTTQPWANAAIYFYAATANASGDSGFYQVDNVSLRYAPAQSAVQTECVDPWAPMAPGGAPGPTLLTNGDFSNGQASWGLFGTITALVTSGVFEFIRPTSTPPAGVVLQATSASTTAGEILTATFELGNSSGVRKRVTPILHDNDFSDLAACTFYLAPGQPLQTYTMRTYATQSWANATISFYAATVGAESWVQLDNVTLQRTPGTTIAGTECVEPLVAPTFLSTGVTTSTPADHRSARAGQERSRRQQIAGASGRRGASGRSRGSRSSPHPE